MKILVAMSGGVDSSVAAFLLKRQGNDVTGTTLRMVTDSSLYGSDCCSDDNIKDAKSVAEMLNLEHITGDYSENFEEKVVKYFAESYMNGETPNPCVVCNRYIKFGRLFNQAEKRGFDKVATGHYARIRYDAPSGRWLLLKGLDGAKDQSYVLYSLTQKQLSRALFPIGELSKEQVRIIAQEQGLINSDKPDSQDICFIPDGDYKAFIERYLGYRCAPGNFVDETGKILGRHTGLIGYTTGQRKGLGVSADRPLYVLRKNFEDNTVLLGDEDRLFKKTIRVRDVNFIAVGELTAPIRLEVKIRYSQKTAAALIIPEDAENVTVEFDVPQRAPTGGQSAVFYDGETIVGGGVITV